MSAILILMHNPLNVKICEGMTGRFLQEQAIDSKILAPVDFVKPGVNQAQMPEKIAKLIAADNDIRIIFFEANLGYPGQEALNATTIEVLQYLIENCPNATFILKSQTEKAIKNAQYILQGEHVPSVKIVPAGGKMKLSEELKELIYRVFEEGSLKMTLP
ncbi:hypothetical protein TUM19329_11990 [Legionella antarctica]|uniref:Uncharacterized protein n=1 Tax=Legionella antarctica TaxID=2708020 RepID=A0A6F8T360_9GAMM|nr:hypothetical protein [Legionella antarctica]BCA94838.1 hypothetical protein TUM19329_11990 [Legionella antarctica]